MVASLDTLARRNEPLPRGVCGGTSSRLWWDSALR